MSSAACHNEIEKALIIRLAEGDRAAFDDLYHRYFHPVYCNALKITRDIPASEDIVQDVFTSLWEKKNTLDVERSLGGWLFVTCYNKSVNVLRKKLRESLLQTRLQQTDDTMAEEETRFGQQWAILENALSRLPPQRRRVFELCKLQGKTYEEAAIELRISKYTVKEYLSAAMVSIREYNMRHPESIYLLLPALFFF